MPDPPREFEDLKFLHELGETLHRGFQEAQPSDRRARRSWQIPAIVVPLAVLAAGVIAVISGLQSGHVAPTPAQALGAVAQRALSTGVPVPADDQFYFVSSQVTDLVGPASTSVPGPSLLVTKRRNVWQSIGRSGQLQENVIASRTVGPPGTTPTPTTTPAQHQPVAIGPISHYNLGGIALSRQQLIEFPTDPRAIVDRLNAHGGNALAPAELFDVVTDALRELPAPADLRAGLFRALALVPGIASTPVTTDSLGRSGAAVTLTSTGIKRELIFDPDSSEILAERGTVVDHDRAQLNVPDGTVIRDTTYLEHAVTDRLPASG